MFTIAKISFELLLLPRIYSTMSDFYSTGQKLDKNLVGSVSSLLHIADVPHLLWGIVY